MLEIDQAREKILSDAKCTCGTEKLSLQDSLGKFLADDIVSNIDVPPADNSAMDGYAIHSAHASQIPFSVPISQRICAGTPPQPLSPQTAARIFTGAEIPADCDAVVMQENCERQANGDIAILTPVEVGQNIRPKGQDIGKGYTILKKHKKLTPQDIGLLASIGVATVCVFKPLTVAIVGTGDELVEPGNPLQPGQIYNSNQPMLSAMLSEMNVSIVSSQWVEDSLNATIEALKAASAQADIVITCGGVSVGDEDHVKNAVRAIGTIDLWKINIKPGKPIALGKIDQTNFIGLPGNPVSAFITFLLFAKPLIYTLQGGIYTTQIPFKAPSLFSVDKPQRRPEYVRVNVTADGIERYSNQSSGVLSSVCHSNALALIPANTTIEKNQDIDFWPLGIL